MCCKELLQVLCLQVTYQARATADVCQPKSTPCGFQSVQVIYDAQQEHCMTTIEQTAAPVEKLPMSIVHTLLPMSSVC